MDSQAALQSFVMGFPDFFLHVLVAGALLVISCVIYVLATPMKEMELVRNGNNSAGLALAAIILGLSLPVATALATSLNLVELLIWGTVSLLIQMLVFRLTDALLGDLPRRITEDEPGAAWVLFAIKLATAILLSAGLWIPAARVVVPA